MFRRRRITPAIRPIRANLAEQPGEGQTLIQQNMPLLERGWNLELTTGRQALLTRIGPTLVSELESMGLVQPTQTVSSWLRNIPFLRDIQPGNSSMRPPLTRNCPSCSASVNPSRVEWLDEITAEYDFCGRPLLGN